MTLEVDALGGALGAEVRGADLHEPLDPDTVATLRRAFDEHHLLLFRAQEITGADQVRVCRHFGPIAPERSGEYGFISNVDPTGVLREGALPFHSDFAFTQTPVHGISLYALQVPAQGAPTVYADAVCVLDRMPADLRTRTEPRSIVNVYGFKLPTDRRMRERDIPPGSPVAERPLVGLHPRTGAPVVTANEMHTDRIVGLSENDSEALLAELFEHLYAPTNTFVLQWHVGDLAIWDNVALQHHRPDFPATEARSMQRVCINDKTAHELVPNMAELV